MIRSKDKYVVLVVGASSGLGLAAAGLLHKEGYVVYGTTRKIKDVFAFHMLELNVTDKQSIEQAVQFIVDRESGIDALVNCAGMGIYGAIEDTPREAARLQFDVNFFGALEVINAVLPCMRNQRRGKIITVGSMAGVIGIPYQGFYSASKFAIEGAIQSLQMELRPYGIAVVRVNPGDFATNFTHNRRKTYNSTSLYAQQANKTLEVVETDELSGAKASGFAKTILRIVATKNPKDQYFIGLFSQVLLIKLRAFIPKQVMKLIMRKHYKL